MWSQRGTTTGACQSLHRLRFAGIGVQVSLTQPTLVLTPLPLMTFPQLDAADHTAMSVLRCLLWWQHQCCKAYLNSWKRQATVYLDCAKYTRCMNCRLCSVSLRVLASPVEPAEPNWTSKQDSRMNLVKDISCLRGVPFKALKYIHVKDALVLWQIYDQQTAQLHSFFLFDRLVSQQSPHKSKNVVY